jgi:hypothetical protein
MNCILCEEPITNPLCPACIGSGVRQWLLERGQKTLADSVSEATLRVFANSGETFCIVCNNDMDVCTYCYTKEIFDLVKSHPNLLQEFVMFFNFDLEHLGWEREARDYLPEGAL